MKISPKRLQSHRANKYKLSPGQQIKNVHEAEQFVNERGFIHFWPIKGVELPSLWAAVAGNRPVANAHDDPGHVTWGWKDESLGKKIWYYGKIIRKKTGSQMVDHLKHHYEWGILVDRKANAADCTQCGQCEEACTQHLNIIERLEQIAEWDEKLKS